MEEFEVYMTRPLPPVPPLKVFHPKNPLIKKLSDYSKPPPEGWWDSWPTLTWEEHKELHQPTEADDLG